MCKEVVVVKETVDINGKVIRREYSNGRIEEFEYYDGHCVLCRSIDPDGDVWEEEYIYEGGDSVACIRYSDGSEHWF